MSRIKFGVIGGGWRAEFFVRVARAIPDVFDVPIVLFRDEGKAEAFREKYNVTVTTDFNELISADTDYIILSVKPFACLENIEKLFKAGKPVLCETPPAASIEELTALWHLVKQYNGKIQVAEQYFVQPLYAAWLKAVELGIIGEVSNINISAIHGYHGINIIRRFLGLKDENCRINGMRYSFPVVKTGGREGRCYTGEEVTANRDRVTFEFEDGKVAFYDFSGIQYHSYIRTRQLNIQGLKGEIDDLTVRYLNNNNEAVTQNLYRDDEGVFNNSEWSHVGLMLNGVYLYKSPFQSARLNDDEIAVATLMYLMKDYVDKGKEFYSLQDALQDSYLSFMMNKTLENGIPLETETQVWYKQENYGM